MGEGQSQTEGESKQTISILHIHQAAIFLCVNHSWTAKKGKSPQRHYREYSTVVINVSYRFIVEPRPLQQEGMMIGHIGIVISKILKGI